MTGVAQCLSMQLVIRLEHQPSLANYTQLTSRPGDRQRLPPPYRQCLHHLHVRLRSCMVRKDLTWLYSHYSGRNLESPSLREYCVLGVGPSYLPFGCGQARMLHYGSSKIQSRFPDTIIVRFCGTWKRDARATLLFKVATIIPPSQNCSFGR